MDGWINGWRKWWGYGGGEGEGMQSPFQENVCKLWVL